MATISRLLKIIGLFCRISSVLLGSFAKETCNFKQPTNRCLTHTARQQQSGRGGSGLLLVNNERRVDVMNLQVSFAKEPYKRDDILQKRPIILRSRAVVEDLYYCSSTTSGRQRWGAGVEYHFQELNEPYAPS